MSDLGEFLTPDWMLDLLGAVRNHPFLGIYYANEPLPQRQGDFIVGWRYYEMTQYHPGAQLVLGSSPIGDDWKEIMESTGTKGKMGPYPVTVGRLAEKGLMVAYIEGFHRCGRPWGEMRLISAAETGWAPYPDSIRPLI